MKIFPLLLSVFQVESYVVPGYGPPQDLNYFTQQIIDGQLNLCRGRNVDNVSCGKILHDKIMTMNDLRREFSCMVTRGYYGWPKGRGHFHSTSGPNGGTNNYYAVCSERGGTEVNKWSFENSCESCANSCNGGINPETCVRDCMILREAQFCQQGYASLITSKGAVGGWTYGGRFYQSRSGMWCGGVCTNYLN